MKRSVAAFLLVLLVFVGGLPNASSAQKSEPGIQAVVVQLAEGKTIIDMQAISPMQIENVEKPEADAYGRFTLPVPQGVTPERFAEELEAKYGSAVRFAEPRSFGRAAGTSDPLWSKQWGVHTVRAEGAWNFKKGIDVPIAVLDSGYDVTHPDLPQPRACAEFTGDGFACNQDPLRHGTHVAGIICAHVNNGAGIAGAGYGCNNLLIGRVLNKDDVAYWDDVARAIDWARESGVRVISISIWSHEDVYNPAQVLADAVQRAVDAGVIIVAAAGNNGVNTGFNFPAQLPGVISVANVKQDLRRYAESNYGYWVTVSAPGTQIWSTLPGKRYEAWTGTSMSTPFVAAAMGLYLSRNNPCRSRFAIDALNATKTALPDGGMGGLLNMETMIQYTIPCDIVYTDFVFLPALKK